MIKLYRGDCLDVMDKLICDNIKVDAIITDPPFGIVACKWDSIIPFDKMWLRLNKLIKSNGAIVLFGSEPFSSALRMSNIKNYKYDWYWNKKFDSNFVQVKRMPLKTIETISVFSIEKTLPNYYPQMTLRDKPINAGSVKTSEAIPVKNNPDKKWTEKTYKYKYPITYLNYPRELGRTVHPTQKPVTLMEYLIKTYTNENETVLDFTMGSGTTIVAAKNLNRNGIGIEKESKYFKIAKNRIIEAIKNEKKPKQRVLI